MDCVKYNQVVCFFSIPLFISLYFIVEFQPNYYKYPIKDQGDAKVAILVGLVVQIIIFVALTYWRITRKRRLQMTRVNDLANPTQAQYANVNFEDEAKKSFE